MKEKVLHLMEWDDGQGVPQQEFLVNLERRTGGPLPGESGRRAFQAVRTA